MNKKLTLLFFLITISLSSIGLILVSAHTKQSSLSQDSLAPSVVPYQGRVQVGGTLFNGTGYFKFAIVNKTGTVTYWSNDGSSTNGSEPNQSVPLDIHDGLFTVLLGDTGLSGMTRNLSAEVFAGSDRYLRVWFRPGSSGNFDRLSPDTRIGAVPYALQAQHSAPPGNMIVVAKSNGNFTSIQAALDSLTAVPAPSNPILIWVAPGWYNEVITLKPNVHLQGAGKGLTYIQGQVANGAVLTLVSDTSVRDLSVSNTASGTTNVGIIGDNVTNIALSDIFAESAGNGVSNIGIKISGNSEVLLENVEASAVKASDKNTALQITASPDGGPEATLHGGSFLAVGGNYAYGIEVAGGSGTFLGAADVLVTAKDADSNVALYSHTQSSVILQGGFFSASGGNVANAIENSQNAHLDAEGVTAHAENSVNVRAILNNNGQVLLRGGLFAANAKGGVSSKAVYNRGVATLTAYQITALASGGTAHNIGLMNEVVSYVVTLIGGSFRGIGGNNAYGIDNEGDLTAQNVFASGENGTSNNSGLTLTDGTARSDGSRFKGTPAVKQSGGSLYLAVCQLSGGMQRTGGSKTCFGVYDGNYAAYACP